tara:strand:- start:204 stop:866 length:663 start_codon:yes stop_codon:yes gene_type:complete
VDLTPFGNPGGLTHIELEGIPAGPGDSDTIIRRLHDASLSLPGDTDVVDVELVGLSLQSVNPVSVGGEYYQVMVTLNPIMPTLGQMEITLDDATLPAGTFTAFFDLFVELALVEPSSHAVIQRLAGLPALHVEGSGYWTSRAPDGALTIIGAPGSPTANTHDPLSSGLFDFYIEDFVFDDGTNEASLTYAKNSVVPEPGTATLLCLGALGMGIKRRWHQG